MSKWSVCYEDNTLTRSPLEGGVRKQDCPVLVLGNLIVCFLLCLSSPKNLAYLLVNNRSKYLMTTFWNKETTSLSLAAKNILLRLNSSIYLQHFIFSKDDTWPTDFLRFPPDPVNMVLLLSSECRFSTKGLKTSRRKVVKSGLLNKRSFF